MLYSIALSAAVVAAVISSIGGVVYLAWNLSTPALVSVLILSLAVSFLIIKQIFKKQQIRAALAVTFTPETNETADQNQGGRAWALGLIPVLALVAVCFIVLSRNQTDVAVNTPWGQVPQIFWISLALASAAGAAMLMRARADASYLATFALLAVGLSVAAIIYRIGYGYDPFVHAAAEQHIINTGIIAPKTVYYSGQYALIVLVAFITKLPVATIGVWLLPALAAISIPAAVCLASRAMKRSAGFICAALLAILPLTSFIDTTPFGLAALYLLLAAILGLGVKNDERLKTLVWLFAAASFMTHPIAGVPAIVLASVIQFKKPLFKILSALVGAIALPVLFAVSAKGFSFSLDRINAIAIPFDLPFTRFHALGDPIYAIGLVAAIIIVIGVFWNRNYLLAAASAALSGLLIAISIDFSYLPDSEQGGYAGRLLVIALLIAAPAAAAAVAKLLGKSASKPWRVVTAAVAIVFFFVGGVYLAYPRADAYVISAGWNTSATDMATVSAISSDANQPYIVLAAQPVSAAALSKFGFFKYYNTAEGQIFAYPVPTGGPLYQYFLKMIYIDPSSEYMNEAMALTGVKLGYFVVNSYWTDSDHIIARAKQTSESWFGINDADYVFRYSQK
jgi:hypothetical protein